MELSYTDNDVLFGRERICRENGGNKHMMALVEAAYDEHEAADSRKDFLDLDTKRSRMDIKMEIIREIKSRGGRFLAKGNAGVWRELSDEDARKRLVGEFTKRRRRKKRSRQERTERFDDDSPESEQVGNLAEKELFPLQNESSDKAVTGSESPSEPKPEPLMVDVDSKASLDGDQILPEPFLDAGTIGSLVAAQDQQGDSVGLLNHRASGTVLVHPTSLDYLFGDEPFCKMKAGNKKMRELVRLHSAEWEGLAAGSSRRQDIKRLVVEGIRQHGSRFLRGRNSDRRKDCSDENDIEWVEMGDSEVDRCVMDCFAKYVEPTTSRTVAPTKKDYLKGKEFFCQENSGNEMVRSLVLLHEAEYEAGNLHTRRRIRGLIASKVQESGGRFLQRISERGDTAALKWTEMSEKEACAVVGQSFRNRRRNGPRDKTDFPLAASALSQAPGTPHLDALERGEGKLVHQFSGQGKRPEDSGSTSSPQYEVGMSSEQDAEPSSPKASHLPGGVERFRYLSGTPNGLQEDAQSLLSDAVQSLRSSILSLSLSLSTGSHAREGECGDWECVSCGYRNRSSQNCAICGSSFPKRHRSGEKQPRAAVVDQTLSFSKIFDVIGIKQNKDCAKSILSAFDDTVDSVRDFMASSNVDFQKMLQGFDADVIDASRLLDFRVWFKTRYLPAEDKPTLNRETWLSFREALSSDRNLSSHTHSDIKEAAIVDQGARKNQASTHNEPNSAPTVDELGQEESTDGTPLSVVTENIHNLTPFEAKIMFDCFVDEYSEGSATRKRNRSSRSFGSKDTGVPRPASKKTIQHDPSVHCKSSPAFNATVAPLEESGLSIAVQLTAPKGNQPAATTNRNQTESIQKGTNRTSGSVGSEDPASPPLSIVCTGSASHVSSLSSSRERQSPSPQRIRGGLGVDAVIGSGQPGQPSTGDDGTVSVLSLASHHADAHHILETVRVMKEKPDDANIQVKCCGDISSFLWGSELNMRGSLELRLIAKEALSAVQNALRRHFDNPKVPCYALEAIEYLCNGVDKSVLRHIDRKTIGWVIQRMRRFPEKAQEQENGCYALARTARDRHNCRLVADADGIAVVLTAMDAYRSRSQIQESGSLVMQKMEELMTDVV